MLINFIGWIQISNYLIVLSIGARLGLRWWLTVFGHVIFLAALINLEALFAIAYTRGTNVFT